MYGLLATLQFRMKKSIWRKCYFGDSETKYSVQSHHGLKIFTLRTWSDGSRIEQLMIEWLLFDIKVLCATEFERVTIRLLIS